jgi:hypothetical protein
MNKVILFTIMVFLAGCTSTPSADSRGGGVLRSRLTLEKVKEIAAARVRENGFQVTASDPWTLSLRADERPYVWTVMLQVPGKAPPGYWLFVNDETGKADFVMPTVVRTSEPPAGSDWLVKVKEGIRQVKFPIRIEEFLRQVHATGIDSDSGGATLDGQVFLDYTLRKEKDSLARFELRCFVATPEGWTGPKIVTRAELSYIDATLNRYLLIDGNN